MYIKLQYISTIPSRNIYQTRFLAFLQKMGDDGMVFLLPKGRPKTRLTLW